MKVKIITDRQPWVHGEKQANGAEVEVSKDEADMLIANGFAKVVKAQAKRARTASGKLKADDPSTPDVNEAWEGGKAPKKAKKAKK